MRENPVDVDFFHLRLRVAADCPFLLGIPLVVLCSRWMKIPDAMFGYLQIATTPVLYVPLVREGRGRLFSVQPPSPRARVGTLRPSSSHTPTRMSPRPPPSHGRDVCVCTHWQSFKTALLRELVLWTARPFAPNDRVYTLLARPCEWLLSAPPPPGSPPTTPGYMATTNEILGPRTWVFEGSFIDTFNLNSKNPRSCSPRGHGEQIGTVHSSSRTPRGSKLESAAQATTVA